MQPTNAITRLERSQIPAAASVLVSALLNDPLACYLFPNPAQRPALLDATLRTHLNYGCLYGQVYSASNLGGVAIWLTPGKTTQTLWRLFRAGTFSLVPRFNATTIIRLRRYMDKADEAHARYVPGHHWYLYYLGVEAERQGQGIGSQLLQPILKQSDERQLPCYLETSAERNLKFYAKHHFKVMGEVTFPDDGPNMWFLLREPQGA